MKLTIFQADKGDCNLITGEDGKHILVDGGLVGSYKTHVSPTLNAMHQNNQKIDLVCVSHIDADHIAGILKMLDDLIDWRIYEYRAQREDSGLKSPKSKRPPEINSILHNGFSDQMGENSGPIEAVLASISNILTGSEVSEIQNTADIISSVRQAIQLSFKVDPRQLNIRLNDDFNGGCVHVQPGQNPITVGNMSLQIIGPTPETLEDLREEWNEWLEDNQEALQDIRTEASLDEERLSGSMEQFMQPFLLQTQKLGQRGKVTTPNLASIMFMVEESGENVKKKVLMTGDGHAKDILDGLKAARYLQENQGIHLNVYKIPHHGSEHNMDKHLCKTITADHYIFCGNGFEHNPDLEILEVLIKSRIGEAEDRSTNPECGNPFTLWFNTSSEVTKENYREHIKNVERLVRGYASQSGGKMTYKFMETGESKFILDL